MIRKTEVGTRVVVALAGVVLTLCAGYFGLHRGGESLISLSYDMPFMVHKAGTPNDLRIVYLNDLDGKSLDRRPQAKLLDKLAEGGAKAVIYDIIFDRESADPAVDKEFADAIRRFRGVDGEGKPVAGMPRRHVMLACGRETFNTTGMAGEQLVPPIDVLLDAADDFGVVAVDDDAYVIRKLSTGTRDEPSLIWKIAQALGANLDESSRLAPRWLNFAGPPPDPGKNDSNKQFSNNNASNNLASAPPIPSCGADSVLRGADPSFFRDKVVVIGGEPGIVGQALGKDLFATPFHRFQRGGKLPLMSGVEVQANGLANLLEKNWLVRSGHGFDLWLVVVAGILLGSGLSYTRPVRGVLAALGLALGCILAGCFSVHYCRYWFPWSVVGFLQVPVALVWGVASRFYVERFFRIKLTAEQAAIRAAFSKYLSPQMLDRLTAEGFRTNLGGEKIQAAMMFTDLEDFTNMCERVRDPQRIVETLNDYFERTTGSIFDHDGVIIKYIGDSIFAVWGAPMADPDAPVKAVRAAWKLFQSDKLVVDGDALKTRIGLNFGEVVAGNTGSTRRVDYTLIGDAVNLASRLEGLNKMFSTHVLISESVRARLNGEFRTRCVGKICVKGRKEFTIVHELLGPAMEEHDPDWLVEFHHALEALEQNDTELASARFEAVNAMRGPRGDGPSRFYLERLKAGEPTRDGIIEIKEK